MVRVASGSDHSGVLRRGRCVEQFAAQRQLLSARAVRQKAELPDTHSAPSLRTRLPAAAGGAYHYPACA
jgi:hypothetical protein